MSIYVALELPVNVRIDFNFVPAPLPSKAARRYEEAMAVREVQKAVTRWIYENFC